VQLRVLTWLEQSGQAIYRFSTRQLREAVYETVPPADRPARHRQVGQILQTHYAENDIVEDLAWHAEQASDAALSLRYSQMAGDKARQVYANEIALEHYNRALTVMQEHPDLADRTVKYELLSGREQCYFLVADYQAQKVDLETMAQLAQDMADPTRQVHVATRQVLLVRLLGNTAAARQLAESALSLAQRTGESTLEAKCLHALASGLNSTLIIA
jgi:predicted ATPase